MSGTPKLEDYLFERVTLTEINSSSLDLYIYQPLRLGRI